MNKSDKNAVSQAYARIKDWCNFLGMPCGNCPFSTPPYDEDEGLRMDNYHTAYLENYTILNPTIRRDRGDELGLNYYV